MNKKHGRSLTPIRRDDDIQRLKVAGVPQRDVALLWQCSTNLAALKLNGYKNISPEESKKLDRLLRTVDKARKAGIK
jgi:hypothetical protein